MGRTANPHHVSTSAVSEERVKALRAFVLRAGSRNRASSLIGMPDYTIEAILGGDHFTPPAVARYEALIDARVIAASDESSRS